MQLASYEDDALWEPSRDLRELAAAQLRSLFAVLARVSPAHSSSCRACVYARRADSLDSPQIRLQRAACWPSKTSPPGAWGGAAAAATAAAERDAAGQPGGGSCYNSFEELEDQLVLHRPAWEPGSSSSSSSSGGGSGSPGAAWDAEASLCQEEVVLLPSSNMLVLPLAEAGILVGLLVVEVSGSSTSSTSSSTGTGPQQQWGAAGLSEDALWCLRMAVPPLAKACAMDLRQALAGAQQEAQQRLARSLLTEARGPLKVLGTFGQMLAPRLQAAGGHEPESDMAAGMLLQGQRLADVVQQLEAALRPTAGSGWRQQWQQQQQQQQLALPAAAPYDSMDESDEEGLWGSSNRSSSSSSSVWAPAPALLQQQQRQQQQQQQQPGHQQFAKQTQLPAAARPSAYLSESASSSSSSSSGAVADVSVEAAGVVHLPGQGTASSLGASSRGIRWGGVQPAVVRPQPSPAAGSSSSSASSASRVSSWPAESQCSAFYTPVPDDDLDVSRTIELVEEGAGLSMESMDASQSCDDAASVAAGTSAVMPPAWMARSSSSSSSSSSSRRTRSFKAAGGFVRPVRQQQQLGGACNLVDVFSNLLAAASKLAAINGINMIVTDPLQLESPASSNASSSSSSSSVGTLLPRPVRPLLVGMAAGACRRVLGAVLDVALQCTPAGGQLSVTARQAGGGVEVLLQHTGEAQPDRLHPTTPGLSSTASAQQAASQLPGANNMQQQQQLVARRPAAAAVLDQRDGGGVPRRGRGSSSMAELAAGAGGSRLVSLEFATQLLSSVGGRLSVCHPAHFINALTGQLEEGSSIQLWLPPAAT